MRIHAAMLARVVDLVLPRAVRAVPRSALSLCSDCRRPLAILSHTPLRCFTALPPTSLDPTHHGLQCGRCDLPPTSPPLLQWCASHGDESHICAVAVRRCTRHALGVAVLVGPVLALHSTTCTLPLHRPLSLVAPRQSNGASLRLPSPVSALLLHLSPPSTRPRCGPQHAGGQPASKAPGPTSPLHLPRPPPPSFPCFL